MLIVPLICRLVLVLAQLGLPGFETLQELVREVLIILTLCRLLDR